MARYSYVVKKGDETGLSIIQTENPEYWVDYEGYVEVSRAKGKAMRKEYCKRELLSMLKPGDTVYCILRSVSRSGMQRQISLCVATDGMRNIDSLAADLMGYPVDKGIKVTGCGMDMGFHLVYNLGRCLFPEGFPVEGRGRNGDTSGHDNDGGYALKHSWL
jgi:hypothetical protein